MCLRISCINFTPYYLQSITAQSYAGDLHQAASPSKVNLANSSAHKMKPTQIIITTTTTVTVTVIVIIIIIKQAIERSWLFQPKRSMDTMVATAGKRSFIAMAAKSSRDLQAENTTNNAGPSLHRWEDSIWQIWADTDTQSNHTEDNWELNSARFWFNHRWQWKASHHNGIPAAAALLLLPVVPIHRFQVVQKTSSCNPRQTWIKFPATVRSLTNCIAAERYRHSIDSVFH